MKILILSRFEIMSDYMDIQVVLYLLYFCLLVSVGGLEDNVVFT